MVETDPVEVDNFINVSKSIYNSPEDIKRIRSQISDYTAVNKWIIDSADVELIANLDSCAAKMNPAMVVAVAASRVLAFALTRMR